MYAKMYEDNNSGREARWVYHPEHKPELSNVIARRAQGYVPVLGKEVPGLEIPGAGDDEAVRVGDVVLMSIATDDREEIRQELKERADESAQAIEREFYKDTEAITAQGMTEQSRARPRGHARIEEREFVFDYVQRSE